MLRLFMGVCFIRHGWPKLRNLNTWAQGLKTPAWLCFLSAGSMWAGGIALIVGLLTPLAAWACARERTAQPRFDGSPKCFPRAKFRPAYRRPSYHNPHSSRRVSMRTSRS